jgi:hypothetical protein
LSKKGEYSSSLLIQKCCPPKSLMEFAAGAETQVSKVNYPENNIPVSLENFAIPTMSVNLSGVDRDVKSDNISVNCIER